MEIISRLVEPTDSDPAMARRQYNLNVVLLGLFIPALIFGLGALVLLLLGQGPPMPAAASLGLVVAFLAAYLIGRQGWIKLASLVPLAALLLTIYIGLSTTDLNHLAITGLAALVTVAGFLFGIPGAFIFTVLSLAAYLLAPTYGPGSLDTFAFTPAAQLTYSTLGLGFGLLAMIGLNWLAIRQATQGLELERRADVLEQERDFAENLIRTAHALIVVLNLDGRVLRVNPYTEQLTGYEPGEIEGLDWFQAFLPGRTRKRIRSVFKDILKTPDVRSEVNPILTKDGRELMIEWHSSTLHNERSEPTAVLAIGIDLTKEIRAREAATAREALLTSLSRLSPIGIGLIKDRKFLLVNDRFCEMIGYTAAELTGQDTRMIYPDDDEYQRAGLEVYNLVTETGIGVAETRMRRKDGVIIHVLEGVAPVDPDDPAGEMSFTTQDITTLKQAEAELRLAQYSIDQASEAILWIGSDGNLLRANPIACRMLNYSEDELLKMRHFAIREDLSQENWKTRWDAIVTERSVVERTRWRRRDGRMIPVEVATCFFTFEATDYIMVFARNISEQLRNEELIRRRTNYLTALNQASARVGRWGLDLEGVLSAIVTNLVEIVGLSFARIWLVDESSNELVLQASAGLSTSIDGEHARFAIDDGHSKISDIIRLRKPFVTNDVQIEPGFNRSWAEKEGIVSFAGYPLFSNSHPMAMIAIFHDEPLDEIIQDVLGSFANQTAIAIRNAQLFKFLESSEANFRGIFEGIQDAILVEDMNGIVLDVNQQACRMFGYEHEKFIGKSIFDLVPSADNAINPSSLVSSDNDHPIETINVRANGEQFPVEISVRIHTLEGQQVMLVVVRDITERKNADRMIRENEERFRSIAETAIDGIVIADEGGFIRYINDAGSRMFGIATEKMVGQPLTIMMPDDLQQLHEEIFRNRSKLQDWSTLGRTLDLEGLKNDGTRFPIQLSLSAYELDQGTFISAIIRDMSEVIETQTRAKAQERLAAIGQLAAGIAHDFNNIMAGIILYSQMLQREDGISEAGRERLGRIGAQAHRGSNLISQILDFSRQSMIELEPTDLASFLVDLKDLLRRTLPESIQIDIETDGNPHVVSADPGRLQQIVMNLAINARDAMPEGGRLQIIVDGVQIDPGQPAFRDIAPGSWVRLRVIDTGVGIPPEYINRIFEPFFTTKEVGKGTGLGLAQVFGIVQQHGGYIEVGSKVNQGTSFTIYLPRGSASDLEIQQVEPEIKFTFKLRVLLVEDDDSVRAAISDMLEHFGCSVREAKTGREALDVLQESRESLDLVLSDMVMPAMGGRQLFEAIREKYPRLTFILMTGYPLGHDTGALLDRQYAILLRKPFSAEELGEALSTSRQRVLQRKKDNPDS